MEILCAVLAVTVIVLTVILVCRRPAKQPEVQVEKTKVIVKTMERDPMEVETQFSMRQAEFFSSEDAQTGAVTDLQTASSNFNGTDGDYADYVRSQAVGSDVTSNHKEFVKDFIGPQSNYTGRTMTFADGNDSYMGTPWRGIRGAPQNLPNYEGNSDQVDDDDHSHYASKMAIQY